MQLNGLDLNLATGLNTSLWTGYLSLESMQAVLADQIFFPDIPEASLSPLAHGKSCLDLGVADAQSQAQNFANFWGMPELAEQMKPDQPLAEWVNIVHKACKGMPSTICFKSSGSTGTPVLHKQNYQDMIVEAINLTKNLDQTKRIVGVVPRHHIYGFYYLVLLPLALGVPSFSFPPLFTAKLHNFLQSHDLLVGFPLFWRAIADTIKNGKDSHKNNFFPKHLDGSSSTGPCPTELILELIDFGLVRMLETYGSSETGGVGRRFHPHEPYSLFEHWELVETGELRQIKRRLRRTAQDCESFGALTNMPDIVVWAGAREFRSVQRIDKAVQVAGENVYPAKIAKHLKTHPLVAECHVRLMRPEEGQRLKAFIVLKKATQALENQVLEATLRQELRQYCHASLRAAECPRSFCFGSALPKNNIGKDADWDILIIEKS